MEVLKKENIYFIPMETLLFILYFNITHFGMIKLDTFLKNNKMYNELSYNRKLYVIKNIFKFIHLSFLSFIALYVGLSTIVYNTWDTDKIRLLGLVYGVPDTYSLLFIPKLPSATKIHHTCVTILYISFLTDYLNLVNITYWRGIVVYCIFSVLSGSVNGYLGLRFLLEENYYKEQMKKFAYYNYLLCISIIWAYQYYVIFNYLFNPKPIGFYLYLIVCHLILYDDIKLIKFLKK